MLRWILIQSMNERCHSTENDWLLIHSKQQHHLHIFEKISSMIGEQSGEYFLTTHGLIGQLGNHKIKPLA